MSVALKASSGTVGSKPSDAGRKVSDVPDSVPALSSWIRGNLADHRVSTEIVLGTFDRDLLSTVMGLSNLPSTTAQGNEISVECAKHKSIKALIKMLEEIDSAEGDPKIKPSKHVSVDKVCKAIDLYAAECVQQRDTSWEEYTTGTLLPDILAQYVSDVKDPITKAVNGPIRTAQSFAHQVHTLSSSPNTMAAPYKAEQAISRFNESIAQLEESLGLIKHYEDQKAQAVKLEIELTKKCPIAEQYKPENSDIVTQLANARSMMHTSEKTASGMKGTMHAKLNGGTYTLVSKADRLKWKIPSDSIENHQGKYLQNHFPEWLRSEVAELYAILPYAFRILDDYDPLKGKFYEPPTSDSVLAGDDTTVSAVQKDHFLRCNDLLAQKLMAMTPESLKLALVTPFNYGADEQAKGQGIKEDGLSLMFSLVTQSSMVSSRYRDSVSTDLHQLHQVAGAGDPDTFVKNVREYLNEAIRLAVPVRGELHRDIIDKFKIQHSEFQQLEIYRSCKDTNDCAGHLDGLLTKIKNINASIKRSTSNDCWFLTSGRASEAAAGGASWAGFANEKCRFGMKCKFINDPSKCKRIHIQQKSAKAKPSPVCIEEDCTEAAPPGKRCQAHYKAYVKTQTNQQGQKRTAQAAQGSEKTEKRKKRKLEQQIKKKAAKMLNTWVSSSQSDAPGWNAQQLALPAPAAAAEVQPKVNIQITPAELIAFQAFKQSSQVQTPKPINTENSKVIGATVDALMTGPQSHKDKIKSSLVNNPVVNNLLPQLLGVVKSVTLKEQQ